MCIHSSVFFGILHAWDSLHKPSLPIPEDEDEDEDEDGFMPSPAAGQVLQVLSYSYV
jgi:hypothetical protein